MGKTPTSVLVLGIIGIIFSALGACGLVFALVFLFVPFGPPNPAMTPLLHDVLYITFTGVCVAIGIPLNFLLLASSIGSLKLRPWARKGMIIYSWAAIAQVIISLIFNVAYVFPMMIAAVPADAAPPVKAGMIGGILGGSCGGLLGLILPICILFFFSRSNVINAFKGIFPTNTASGPDDFNAPLPPLN